MLSTLAEKAKIVAEAFNSVEGVTCNPVMGAMYSFPNIKLPQNAINKAKVRMSETLCGLKDTGYYW